MANNKLKEVVEERGRKGKKMVNEEHIAQKQDTRHLAIYECHKNIRFQIEAPNPLDL